jgi:RNA polymerase sigma factor (sigma-70 family)
MNGNDWLTGRFEASRPRLRAMAYRMLGSLGDAEDAVQESWIRVAGADADVVDNLDGWFTTIVARICLDMLRSRTSRREDPLVTDPFGADPFGADPPADGANPEAEAVLADSVGLAMLVVLDTLPPAERVAFVLHDTFALPFDEIATITGRTPAAARQLASRARRRIHGVPTVPSDRLARQRRVAEAFIAAARGGDLSALLAILDPDVVLRGDAQAGSAGQPVTLRGALNVARGASYASTRAHDSRLMLIDGTPGIAYAPHGRLALVLAFTIPADTITQIDVIADPARLAGLKLSVLSAPGSTVRA